MVSFGEHELLMCAAFIDSVWWGELSLSHPSRQRIYGAQAGEIQYVFLNVNVSLKSEGKRSKTLWLKEPHRMWC